MSVLVGFTADILVFIELWRRRHPVRDIPPTVSRTEVTLAAFEKHWHLISFSEVTNRTYNLGFIEAMWHDRSFVRRRETNIICNSANAAYKMVQSKYV